MNEMLCEQTVTVSSRETLIVVYDPLRNKVVYMGLKVTPQQWIRRLNKKGSM